MLKKEKYQGFDIFCYEDKYIDIAKRIINQDYKTIRILKNTKRNYVSEIEIKNENYIMKEPRNEYIIPQRKLMSLFKKGEVVNTLINLNELKNKYGISEYAEPFLAVVKRKNGMIVYSFLLIQKIVGKEEKKLEKLVNLMKKIHEKGFYHGDFNPSNFIKSNDNIYILDTQGKKMFFGNYRAHYDMLTMKMDSYEDMKYPYKKNVFFYIALFVKKIKKLKFIEEIKKRKKKLREKGWKI